MFFSFLTVICYKNNQSDASGIYVFYMDFSAFLCYSVKNYKGNSCYYLSFITAAGQGIDFSEAFWKRDGFLIVNFEITGLTGDKKYLSYDNSWNAVHGYCNMWLMEAQICEKKDKETDFRLCPGDVLIIPLESSIRNDYIAGGIY